MRSIKSAIFAFFSSAAICVIAHSLESPVQRSDRRSHLQQALGASKLGGEDDTASTLRGAGTLQELFWSLTTTDDALNALDQANLTKHRVKPHHIALGHHLAKPSVEAKGDQHVQTNHPACLEVYMSTIGGYPIYHTPIALGNPAQPFRAWLHTGLNGLYVRSSACSQDDCADGFTYDGTHSTTRKSLEQRFEVNPKGWTVGGNISTEILHLASLRIHGATVGEIDKYEGEELFYYVMSFLVDGALGLAPPNPNSAAYSPLSSPNPLQDLLTSHALEHNVFTLTLPTNIGDRGSLQIGRLPGPHEEIVHIPFANQTTSGLANTWHVPLDSVSLAGRTKLHLPLQSVYGRLDLDPAIMLPPKTTEELYKAIGANPNSLFRGAAIDCNDREKLPDFVMDIGGNEITLTRDEYSAEHFAYGRAMCVVLILPSVGESVAVLGTQVMMKYHVVVDIDEGEMGLVRRA